MIVVEDSGPLHYLILLDHTELLRHVPALITRLETTSCYVDAALLNSIFEPWLRR